MPDDPLQSDVLAVLARGPHFITDLADAVDAPNIEVRDALLALRGRGLVTQDPKDAYWADALWFAAPAVRSA